MPEWKSAWRNVHTIASVSMFHSICPLTPLHSHITHKILDKQSSRTIPHNHWGTPFVMKTVHLLFFFFFLRPVTSLDSGVSHYNDLLIMRGTLSRPWPSTLKRQEHQKESQRGFKSNSTISPALRLVAGPQQLTRNRCEHSQTTSSRFWSATYSWHASRDTYIGK